MKFAISILLLFFVFSYDNAIAQEPSATGIVFSNFTLSEQLLSAQLSELAQKKALYNNNKLDGKDITSLLNDIISNSYYLNHSYELKYNLDQNVNDEVERIARTIILQPNGLLYNAVTNEKIIITHDDILQMYNKSNKRYIFEYFKFVHDGDYKRFWESDTFFTFKDSHISFTNTFTSNNEFIFEPGREYRYPFGDLTILADTIGKMKPGEISHPIYDLKCIYIIHMINIIGDPQKSFEELYTFNKRRCEIDCKKKLAMEYENTIHKYADTRINTTLADQIYKTFSTSNDIYKFTPIYYSDSLDEILMTYTSDDSLINVSTSNFFDYYNKKPLLTSIDNKYQFYLKLWEYVFDKCAYQDAVDRGITTTDSFLIDKQLYKHRVMLAAYEEDILFPQISLSEKDITDYYYSNLSHYTITDTLITSIIECSTVDDANFLYNLVLSQPPSVDSLTYAYQISSQNAHWRIYPYQQLSLSTAHIPARSKQELLLIPEGMVTRPTEQDSTWYLFIKHAETGKQVLPLEEVRDQIVATLQRQKLAELKAKMLPELKKKYKLVDNIDYEKYLSDKWIQRILAEQNTDFLTP